MTSRTAKFVLPVVFLLAGLGGAALLASSRKTPERQERPVLGPLVEVISATRSSVDTIVRGTGEVRARTTVEIVPQVTGMVIEVHPSLVPGGHFAAGETLVVIEPRDYELAVERAQAAVARAAVSLEREQAEAEVALQEWNALNPGEEPSSGLVIREPQVRQAEAELAAADADLAVARLNLERTRISLPFDGIVVSENVDLGQFATVGRTLATAYGTDEVEVRVPLAERELSWFRFPQRGSGTGPEARVITTFGGPDQAWHGRVVRMEAQVDPTSRMVPVVVSIRDPFKTDGNRLPLIPGSFVQVEIHGGTLEDVISLPRHAIHDGDTAWVVDGDTLHIREVQIARKDLSTAFIIEGIDNDEQVVVSSLDAVTDGMIVRAVAAEPAGGTE